MKKLITSIIILVLLTITVVPALASGGQAAVSNQYRNRIQEGGQRGKGTFSLVGTITSLDPTNYSVTVLVACGSKLVKPFIGQYLTIQTNEATRFLLRNLGKPATPITYGELEIGQNISINGKVVDNLWTANRITVGAELECTP